MSLARHPSGFDFRTAATPVLDRRLDRELSQPVAVAYSGGGDSLAALIAVKAWADACGRPVIALHVDHRLQPASGEWAHAAARTAARIGAECQLLTWTGDKPASGLAAAARRARHALIAEAARAAGASVVVFAHTADDLAESAVMHAAGSSVGLAREWGPSPAWPEGRDVFVLRPLLGVRRAAIREALAAEGWSWIDDPANDDLRQPRARARHSLAAGAVAPTVADAAASPVRLDVAEADGWGAVRLDREALRRLQDPAARRVLAAAMVSAGGGERPPRGGRAAALLARLVGREAFTATLAGARVVAGRDALIARDAGEIARRGLAPLALESGRAAVWDGRFELAACRPGLAVMALTGAQAQLAPDARRRLKAAPAEARPALPLVFGGEGAPVCPILAGGSSVDIRCLVGARFSAACGGVSKEPEVRMDATNRARGETAPGALS